MLAETPRIHYSDLWQGIAREVPERTAIITRDGDMTWGQFADESGALARYLVDECGLQTGDAAATLLYNRPEYLTFTWACLATGVAPVALNYRYNAREVRALLVDSDSRALFAPASFAATAAEAAAGLDIPIVIVDDSDSLDDSDGDAHDAPDIASIPGAVRYEDIVAAGGTMPAEAPAGAVLRLYTGGTTGAPKAVEWDLDTLLEARRQSTWAVTGIEPPTTLERAIEIAIDPATPNVVTLPMSPLLHGTAQSMTMGTLSLGGTVVLHARASMDLPEVYRLMTEHRATRLIVAGDALALPLADIAEQHAGLPQVKWIFSSGMRFSDDVKRRLHSLGDLEIIDLLASSEGGPYAFGITKSVDDLPARLVLTPGAVLLDQDYNEISLEAGALGLLGYRGVLPKGYYGDPEKTAKTFLQIRGNRYVVPGDWARSNGDGTIELLGRLSAVVNTGGEKVFPSEVEEVLLEHPSVGDAIVFGLPHPRFGEAVSAMVAPAEGAEIDRDELLDFVASRLAGFKKPRHLFVRETLGRSITGKVELARVKQDALNELQEANV
jgi:acyl-CoA synthetase (AMP-forming)/AMP-acid ligase II